MAATYSSFMTTRFYSPVFNTALFDGPIRFYFSQSYENVALKIYHLMQSEHSNLWADLKNRSAKTKEHIFLMIYPDQVDLNMVFTNGKASVYSEAWSEGLAIGLTQSIHDEDIKNQLQQIARLAQDWLQTSSSNEARI
jgi:hypothetical protein